MGTADLRDGFLEGLDARLPPLASDKRRRWWTGYLKGAAEFRGVAMSDVRAVVNDLVAELQLTGRGPATYLAIARPAMARSYTEDKLAGILLLAEHGLDTLRLDHLDALAAPLAAGDLSDWNSCDWYCVKVLSGFVQIQDEVEARSRAVAAWSNADSLWQRRASAVAFVHLARWEPEPFPGFIELMGDVCRRNAQDDDRWSQTSVGWLLRELSHRYPKMVEQFVATHPELSPAARRNALKKLRQR